MPRLIHSIAPALLCALALCLLGGCTSTGHVYLTWQQDPSTTMTVNYHSRDHYPNLVLHYDTESRNGAAEAYAHRAEGSVRQIPGLKDGRYIYHIEATGLAPGEVYHFVLASAGKSLTSEMRFRPLPGGDAPVQFISGGDMAILPRARQLSRLAAEHDPMFGLIGGDMAYANGELGKAWMWDRWLKTWQEEMVTSDDVMIPMVLGIGNHEVNDREGSLHVRAPFYYGYFPQGGLPYFTLRIRDDTLLVVLDTGHTIPHEGEQTEWLKATLEEHKDVRNKIAVYHVPLYPSYRSFDDSRAAAGREHWLPLFDQYGLKVAFENHDHSFKRTKVLKNNEVSETGTVYLGDGSMGVNPRDITEPDRWYLEKASGTPHFWVVRIDDEGMHFKAVSHASETLDELTIK